MLITNYQTLLWTFLQRVKFYILFFFFIIQKYLNNSDDFAYFFIYIRMQCGYEKFTIFFSLLHVYRCCWNVKRTDKLLLQYISSMIMVSIFTAVYSSFSGREKNLCLLPLHGRDYTIDKCSKPASTIWKSILVCQKTKKLLFQWSILQGKRLIFLPKKKNRSAFFLVGSLFLNYLIFNLIDSMTFNRSWIYDFYMILELWWLFD